MIFSVEKESQKHIISESSVHGMQQTVDVCKEDFHGLCFTNLVDFDTLWDIEEIQSAMQKRSRNLMLV